jgi:hypothetical protein
VSVHRTLTASTLLAVAAAAAVALPAGLAGAEPGAAAGMHDRSASHGTVAEVRRAIAPYRDVAVALAAGYSPVGPCATSPTGEGAMGIHYLNPAYAAPGPVDPEHPAVLLYAPRPDGSLQLLGAEFFQPAVGQPAPELAGQPFDGPMPGHVPGMPEHYDLHVWTEVANPDGVFTPWNPRVSC